MAAKKNSLSTIEGCIKELQRMLQEAIDEKDRKGQLEVILAAASVHVRSGSKKSNHSVPAVEFDPMDKQTQRKLDGIMRFNEQPLVPGLDPIGSREQELADPRFAQFIEDDASGLDDDLDLSEDEKVGLGQDALDGLGADAPEDSE